MRLPLEEELEGVGEGAFMPVAEFALRKDMVVVVVVVEVEDAVGQCVGGCCLVEDACCRRSGVQRLAKESHGRQRGRVR